MKCEIWIKKIDKTTLHMNYSRVINKKHNSLELRILNQGICLTVLTA